MARSGGYRRGLESQCVAGARSPSATRPSRKCWRGSLSRPRALPNRQFRIGSECARPAACLRTAPWLQPRGADPRRSSATLNRCLRVGAAHQSSDGIGRPKVALSPVLNRGIRNPAPTIGETLKGASVGPTRSQGVQPALRYSAMAGIKGTAIEALVADVNRLIQEGRLELDDLEERLPPEDLEILGQKVQAA